MIVLASSKVVSEFRMDDDLVKDRERLTVCSIRVFEFLFEHSAISRVSILGDLNNYSENCKSIRTQQGLMNLLKEKSDDEDTAIKVFMLTAAMQVPQTTSVRLDNLRTQTLLVWCLYFIPVGILSWLHFRKSKKS